MYAAPENFRWRLFDVDDPELRYKFLQDVLRWGRGETDEPLKRTFQEYEREGRRLPRTLRQLQAFSPEFDAPTLDAFIHLTAPPSKPVPAVEMLPKPMECEVVAKRIEGVSGVGVRQRGGILFMSVPAGKFLMGSKEDNPLALDNEKPQHTMEITQEFWIGRFPVTNQQFDEFVQKRSYSTTAEEKGWGNTWNEMERKWEDTKSANWRNPHGPRISLQGRENHPVVQISWLDAQEFCRWLNQMHGCELLEG
jgi:hypothetical protein